MPLARTRRRCNLWRPLSQRLETEPQVYAKLIAGEAQLKKGNARDALNYFPGSAKTRRYLARPFRYGPRLSRCWSLHGGFLGVRHLPEPPRRSHFRVSRRRPQLSRSAPPFITIKAAPAKASTAPAPPNPTKLSSPSKKKAPVIRSSRTPSAVFPHTSWLESLGPSDGTSSLRNDNVTSFETTLSTPVALTAVTTKKSCWPEVSPNSTY